MLPIIDESSSFFSSEWWFAVRLPLLMLIVLLVPVLTLDAHDRLFLAAMLTVRVALMHSLYPFKIGESGSCFGEFASPRFALLLEDEERNPNRRFSRFIALSVMIILWFLWHKMAKEKQLLWVVGCGLWFLWVVVVEVRSSIWAMGEQAVPLLVLLLCWCM